MTDYKKIIFYLFFFCSFLLVSAQVGINSNDPKTTLEINAIDSVNPPTSTGLTIPRVEKVPIRGENLGQLIFNTSLNSFQYWDGLQWNDLQSSGSKLLYTNTKISQNIEITNATTQAQNIPGLDIILDITKKQAVTIKSFVSLSSLSNVLHPQFKITITNLNPESGITDKELTGVSRIMLGDGISEIKDNATLQTIEEFEPGQYQIKVSAFYNNCCVNDFSYNVGGEKNNSILIVQPL